MRRSIATVCLSGTLEDKLSAAAARGSTASRSSRTTCSRRPLSPGGSPNAAPTSGWPSSCYQPFRDFEAVPEELHRRNLRRAARKFALARAARRGHRPGVLVGRAEAVDDDALAAAQLRALADLAAEHGVRVAYEALAWGKHVGTWERSAELVLRADHPALGLCLDSFHVLSGRRRRLRRRRLPRREALLPPARRRPAHAHGRAPVEPPPPPVPRAGRVRPRRFPSRMCSAPGTTARCRCEVFNDVFRQAPPAARPSTRCAP